MDKLRLYDKKIGKFGFLKNGAGIGENVYQVRYGSLHEYKTTLIVNKECGNKVQGDIL